MYRIRPLKSLNLMTLGKTLLFSNIVDMIVESKRKLYLGGILEVNKNNYYKVGSHSYIKADANTSSIKIEYGTSSKIMTYIDVMSRNPEEAISRKEIINPNISGNTGFKESGFYKKVDLHGVKRAEFEKSVWLYFPFDRYYRPLWYNSDNYNKAISSAPSNVGHSSTNIVKIDILKNVKDWLRTIYLQAHMIEIKLPDDASIPSEIRGRVVTLRKDTKLQSHLKNLLSIIKHSYRT